MSSFMRTTIVEKIAKILQHVSSKNQERIMSSLLIQYHNIRRIYSFLFPLKSPFYDGEYIYKKLSNINVKDPFDDIAISKDFIYFNIARDKYVKQVVENNIFGIMPPPLLEEKNIIVEFSSPNIAKPFHVGHLRSTVIGNYIANINTFMKNKVTRINYVGDWGTQIGYILLGMQMDNISHSHLGDDALKKLYTAYVIANKAAEFSPEIHEAAKSIFTKLESGDPMITKTWHEIKHYTAFELEKTYKRIGITFDKYDWESMYSAENIAKVIKSMEDMQLLTLDRLNRKVISFENKVIPITKSDGSSLYISRDIAAAIDRFDRNKFDVMYYVVDYSQSEHFSNLTKILHKMELSWEDRLRHIPFGRVHGMSTRAGTAVFLEDILDEAQNLMRQRQQTIKTTKVTESELDKSSDILGISGVIVQNLKQQRMHSYKFDWNFIYNMKGDSGISMQYTHCRLCRLEELCIDTMPTECDPSALKEPEVDNLILLISQFDNAVLQSYNSAESCVLTAYLYNLCHSINSAFKTLRIRDAQNDLRNQRLLLFRTARLTLAQGMKLLGLTPLQRM